MGPTRKRDLAIGTALATIAANGAAAHVGLTADAPQPAIKAFDEAYRLAPRPGVTFSLAQAHRRQYGLDRKPDDLRGALLLLASDAGAYITGHTLVVDGGLTTILA